jgi:hypothetical protein
MEVSQESRIQEGLIFRSKLEGCISAVARSLRKFVSIRYPMLLPATVQPRNGCGRQFD